MSNKAQVTDIFERRKVTAQQAREAVSTLIEFSGDSSSRAGVLETPERVVKSYGELFKGYSEDPLEYLERTFEDSNGYKDPVIVSGITFHSTCEHHMLPFMGVAHVAYIPQKRVVGLSKLSRVVHSFARRLQMQERMTQQIADCLTSGLATDGVAVVVQAYHTCMMMRGVRSEQAKTTTMILRGAFDTEQRLENRLFQAVNATPFTTPFASFSPGS